jgi:chaperone protein DnaJ
VRLTDKQKQMLRELDQSLSDAKHSPQTRSWKDRLKEFFQ